MNEAVISIPASSWWARAAACKAVLACAFLADGARAVDAADTIYRNGVAYTVDGVRSRAQVFAIKNGKFVTVGLSKQADRSQTSSRSVVSIQSRGFT